MFVHLRDVLGPIFIIFLSVCSTFNGLSVEQYRSEIIDVLATLSELPGSLSKDDILQKLRIIDIGIES